MNIIRNVLRLKKKDFLTPHLIRITLEGEGVAEYKNCTLGNNNKIYIPPAGVRKVHLPVYNQEKETWESPDASLMPLVRTYTHRAIDTDTNEIVIDFVNHGETGPASSWAIHAQKGDELGVAMKDSSKELFPEAEWYLLAGDSTAIPVLSCILEALPNKAKGICVLEVHGPEDELKIETRAAIQFIWLYNPHPESGSVIQDRVRELVLPEGSRFGYIAAEYRSVKDMRAYLKNEKGWSKEEFYAFSYWKAGVAEDQSAKDRRAEKDS